MLDNSMTSKNCLQLMPLSTHSTSNDESLNYSRNKNLDTFFKYHEDPSHHNLDLGFDDEEEYDSESDDAQSSESNQENQDEGGDVIDEEGEEESEVEQSGDEDDEQHNDQRQDQGSDCNKQLTIHPLSIAQQSLSGQQSQDLDQLEQDQELQVEMDLTQNHNQHFYKEFCRLQMTNALLGHSLQGLIGRGKIIGKSLSDAEKIKEKHEKVLNIEFEVNNEKKRRNRRIADAIARQFECPVESCGKCYGMEGTLTQHIKIKHPDYYKNIVQQGNSLKQNEDKPSSISSKNMGEYNFKGF